MDNNRNERKLPDISFGSGAPAGMLDTLSRPLEKKPSAQDTPAGAHAKPAQDDISANFGGKTPELRKGNTAQMNKPAQDTRNDISANFGGKTPELRKGNTTQMNKPAQDTRNDISANFGGNTQNAPVIGADKTRPFVKPPHGERSAAPVNPENEDVTKHFGRTQGNTADLDAAPARRRPVRGEQPERDMSTEDTAERPAPPRRRRPVKKKKEHMFNTSIITGLTITIVVISASIVLATQGITLGMEYLGYNKSDKQVTFNIPEGADSEQIIDLLIDNDIINNRLLFKAALKFSKVDILYPGDITLQPNKSYPEIISLISKQRELFETVTLTFAEGTNLRAVAAKLEKNGVCNAKDFLWQFNKKLDLPLDSKINHSSDVYLDMEGYFFPDTYEFYKNDSPYNVAKTVRENFDKKITADMYTRMSEMGMDLNQVVTLASIVQSEAGNAEQMPIIASIFLNRLKDSQTFPNLQSDATKNYVTNVIDRVETSTAMLEHYTNVYDTYVCFGLPAGPVCNPGLEAINAVLHPADTDYYYFCNNLETGEAFYEETYEQHQKNLKKAGLKE